MNSIQFISTQVEKVINSSSARNSPCTTPPDQSIENILQGTASESEAASKTEIIPETNDYAISENEDNDEEDGGKPASGDFTATKEGVGHDGNGDDSKIENATASDTENYSNTNADKDHQENFRVSERNFMTALRRRNRDIRKSVSGSFEPLLSGANKTIATSSVGNSSGIIPISLKSSKTWKNRFPFSFIIWLVNCIVSLLSFLRILKPSLDSSDSTDFSDNSLELERKYISETEDVVVSLGSAFNSPPPRRSIRIHENALKPSDISGTISSSSSSSSSNGKKNLKSPTSPGLRTLTKYPTSTTSTSMFGQLPRTLLPRHMMHPQKTLILDLDETLIHSLSKGGKMSSGHMVEVKLDGQHAILYYVHKRPFCDEFLRKVSKWYNLVVFTASVQEYADPVIDWLEQERKVFRARYYRQHCTFRNGGYVKDITVVEPDLSRVMIIDNSPVSYTLHEDNAIAIEGWINDPSDLDLLHLVPFLSGMRFVNDVRSIVSLRMGDNAFNVDR